MTEEFDLTEKFNEPEYREVNERGFLEGEVGAFVEYGERVDDYYEYDGHYIAADSLDAHHEHPAGARVQIHTVEYEPDTDKCPDCGESYKSVEMHLNRSDCDE